MQSETFTFLTENYYLLTCVMTPVGLSEIPLGCMQGLDTGYF